MFVVVSVPNFALQALLRQEPAGRDQPVALIQDAGSNLNKSLVLECTTSAANAGVLPGLTAPQAQARCRELILKVCSPVAEQAATAVLLQTAYAFSPHIENTAPGVCTIDLRGLNFEEPPKTASPAVPTSTAAGPMQQGFEFDEPGTSALERWSTNFLNALANLGLSAQAGVAATPGLALLAARAARPILLVERSESFFKTLPVAALEPPAAILDLLQRWGIHSVGEFLSLGKDALAERLGPAALELFERATDRKVRPLEIVVPVDTFEEEMEFEARVETIEPLLFVLRRFVEQLATRVALTHRVIGELRLTLELDAGPPSERTFKVPAPTASVETLFRMLHTHLENLRTDAPVKLLRLVARPVEAQSQQFNLFESALRDPNHFHETLARLTALLGNDRVGTPVPENTHRPDAFRMQTPAFQAERAPDENDAAPAFGLCLRRYRPALPARVTVKDGHPFRVETPSHIGQVRRVLGPFSLSGTWWIRNQGWVRREWDVETTQGALYRLCDSNGVWTVEGVYDGEATEPPASAPAVLSKSASAPYVELHCRTAFSFLRGGSRPEELAATAAEKGLAALAVCDRDGVYGTPLASGAAVEQGIRPIVGAEITLEDESVLPVLVQSRQGYQNLCRLLTSAHLRAEKGKPRVRWDELPEFAAGLVALTGDEEGPLVQAITQAHVPARHEERSAPEILKKLTRAFGQENVFVEVQRHRLRGERRLNNALVELARAAALPLLATNGVTYARAAGRQVMDVFTCLRHHTHLDAAGALLAPNSERHLMSPEEMGRLFHDLPDAIGNTTRLAERLEFSLENLGYEFPRYTTPNGESMEAFLKEVTYSGARRRYPGGIPPRVDAQLKKELQLINKLGFAGYFLIVWDIVRYCQENNIMAQGRGSAANSAVCYCLHITAVDAVKADLLFERFLSEGRKSWPDIDIDLPSGDRREQVIQEVYRRYGKRGAAMTANVITYRGRSAAREIGKVLNIGPDILDRFSAFFANGDFPHTMDLLSQMKESGLPSEHPRAPAFATLYQQIKTLPRHLGQHSGGMIISQDKLDTVMPLENASMPGRVVAQWDKDDCERLGIIKVDLLGLGMMSVLQDAVQLTRERGHAVDLARIPMDDEETFKLMRAADTVGVFQIESRAQMATLPRMKPECFYDVCIEVAIIRPGPIQGNLTHPYLKRRAGLEKETYYDPELEPLLRPILGRTKGVPLFQEQMLAMAMVLADFSGSKAEELRRALSFHRSDKEMQKVSGKLREALERKGHKPHVIEAVMSAITSFALYGFPESHAISFAHMAYASAFLKVHRPLEFYASLLNNQPMGFYSSATLIKDAQRRGVHFKPVCVLRSEWNCTIKPADETSPPNEGESSSATANDLARFSIRLGLRVVRGLHAAAAGRLLAARAKAPFASLEDFKRRVRLSKEEARTLAEIGAFNAFSAHRRAAMWKVEAQLPEELFAPRSQTSEDQSTPLLPMNPLERLRADFAGTHLTVGQHPMALVRSQLKDVWRAADLAKATHGTYLRIAGNVICRQRPGTAKGVVFVSLEDETGIANAIVRPELFEALRLLITEESFLMIEGRLQNVDNVIHVYAEQIERLQHPHLAGSSSYDFH